MKIAICVPSRDMVHAAFAYDLTLMTSNFCAGGGEVALFNSQGTLIADQRENMVREALDFGADAILWLDSDMRFPKNTLRRLLAHEQPIVAANYVTRAIPPIPVTQNHMDGGWVRVYTSPDSTGLESVDLIGFGCALIHADVFRKMNNPWFHLIYSSVNKAFHGEDAYFCMKAREAGFDVLIDHDLSKEIKHIGCFEFRHEHAIIDPED
jgi:hypothetical protein